MQLLPFAVQHADVGIRRDPLEDRLPLAGRASRGRIGSGLAELHRLEAGVAAPAAARSGPTSSANGGRILPTQMRTSRTGCDTRSALSDENERERHINMHMSPETMAGAYANFANISHSDYEFTITFARLDHEVDEDEIPGVVVSRISASPKFVRELIDALEDNYSKWSTREGIKNLPEYRGEHAETGTSRAAARPLSVLRGNQGRGPGHAL